MRADLSVGDVLRVTASDGNDDRYNERLFGNGANKPVFSG